MGSPEDIQAKLLEAAAGTRFSTASRRIEVCGAFWVRPVARYGFLWCLSRDGEVLRLSPFDSQAVPYGVLGPGFGTSPFTIADIETEPSKQVVEPYLIAANRQAIKGVSLLTKGIREFYSAEPGEYVLSDIAESYSTVDLDGETICFLKVRDGQAYLGTANEASHRDFRLPVTDVAGPLRIGSRVFVYSPDHLFVLDEDAVVPVLDFEAIGFRPWVSPPQESHFLPPFGRSPNLVRGNTIYMPGEKQGVTGLLFVSLRGLVPKPAFIPARGEGNFAQDEDGRPIISSPGEIFAYEETASVSLSRDDQLIPRGQPFHRAPLTVGFTRTAGGVESLRFYKNEQVTDFSLASVRNLIDVGLFSVAGGLMFVYQTERDMGNLMRIVVWEL